MNKHIELVKKWLADPDSVTEKELEKNRAYAVASVAYFDAAYAAAAAYRAAACAAADGAADDAVYWVEQYEALEKDNE